ncbi:MAG: hypothetical protein RJB13_893 [Pseudomonadota bacterium]
MLLPSGSTEMLALFGAAIHASPSPRTHTHWAQSLGLNLLYLPLTCTNEAEFLNLASSLMSCPQFRGGNITNPFKTAALKLPNIELNESTLACGAGNTLHRIGDSWRLSNTDLSGCESSIHKILKDCSLPIDVFILGTGAMSRTVSVALDRVSSELQLKPRKILKISRGVLELGSFEVLNSILPTHCLVINTLPGSTQSEADTRATQFLSSLASSRNADSFVLFELSYTETQAIQFARSNGWAVETGHHLFETQAKESFKLWTNHYPPSESDVQWPNRE